MLCRCNRIPLPDRLRLPLDFDPQRLADDLAALSSGPWTVHFVHQNYEGDWSAIALRASASARHPIQMILSDPTCADFIDTPFLASTPCFQEVLGQFGCPLLSVRLMRLAARSIIKEHRDHDLSFEQGTVRLHVPVVTNGEVDFRLNGLRCEMPAGSTWYLRLSDAHTVANRGMTERVHMVIDATVNDWLADLFRQACGTGRGPAA